MKITIASLILLLSASAASADDGKPSNLSVLLSSLSSLLSSTNPSANYNNTEPKSGETPIIIASTPTRVSQLPPLIADPDMIPMPKKIPNLVPIDSNDEAAIKLSPSTKRLIEMTPSGINGNKRQLSSKLQIMHGQFENDASPQMIGAAANAPAAPVVAAKPKFEISVQDTAHSDPEAVVLDKALSALKIGQYESSVALYKEVLSRDPNNRDALFGMATAYHKNGQRQLAKQTYAKLMEKYPDFKDGLNNVLLFAGEEAPDDALVELNTLSKKNPHFAPIYAQEASIYFKKGDNQQAASNLVKALAIEPDNILYKYNLATCYDRMNDNANALKLYNNLIDLNYQGNSLPVPRESLVERAEYLGGQKIPAKTSQTAMR